MKTVNSVFKVCFYFLFFLAFEGYSQNLLWAKGSTSAGNCEGKCVRVDGSGNVYTAGQYIGLTDFDPGVGVFTLTTQNQALFLSKLDASGNFLWAVSVNSGGVAWTRSIDLDAFGNIFLSVNFYGTADFDPGPGTATLQSSPVGEYDFAIVKLNPLGALVWVKQIGGSSSEFVMSIVVDAPGNVYSTGLFQGTSDFDPGPGTYNLVSAGLEDAFISKLDPTGNFVWAKNFEGTSSESGTSIAFDPLGNVYTSGSFGGVVDFNSGIGTYTLDAFNYPSTFISKLDTSGNFIWARKFDSLPCVSDYPCPLALDASGNIYMGASFSSSLDIDPGINTYTLTAGANPFNACVVKLDAGGNFIWVKQIEGNFIGLTSLDIDGSNNIYATGMYALDADFDPGPGTYTLNSPTSIKFFILKLNSSGNLTWALSMGGNGVSGDDGRSIITDNIGNAYVTGRFIDQAYFNAGSGNYTLTAVNMVGAGAYALKLDCSPPSAGAISGASVICSSASTNYSIAPVADAAGYTWSVSSGMTINSGQTTNSVSINPGIVSGSIIVTPTNSCGSGISSVLQIITLTSTPVGGLLSGPASICTGSSASYSISGVTGLVSAYSWSVPVGAVINTAAPYSSVNITFGTQSGTILASAGNVCGMGPIISLLVNTNPLPLISPFALPQSTVCAGSSLTLNGSGANTYNWSNNITNGQAFFPAANSTYTVTGTDVNNCVNSSTISVFVNALPIVTAALSNSQTVCAGTFISLNASGANSYTWSNNVPNNQTFSVTATSIFSVTGVDLNNCTNTTTISVTVYSPATITPFALPSSTVCTWSFISLNAGGAVTYTWNNGWSNGYTFSPTVSCTFTVYATDINGCTNNSTLAITVLDPPLFTATAQPSPPIICSGNQVTLSGVFASTYTWSSGVLNGVAFTPSATAVYTAIGTGVNGCTNTAYMTVVVNDYPVITQPINQQVLVGSNAQFIVNATGSNLSYQWQQNTGSGFVDLTNSSFYSGATSSILTLNNVLISQDSYNFRCIVAKGTCADTSGVATLTVSADTGLKENQNSRQLKIYPTPTLDYITIEVDPKLLNAYYVITDLSGRNIISGMLNSPITKADLSSVAKGLYFLSIIGYSSKAIKITKE